MMHSFIPFLQMFLLLLIGGTAIALVLLPHAGITLAVALSLPLATLANALLIFVYTVTGVPLNFVTIVLGNIVIIIVMMRLIYRRSGILMDLERLSSSPKEHLGRMEKLVIAVSLLLIAANISYSAVHAVLLPTNQFDSLTNWTMRSEISFVDHRMAFDASEARGMAKPQYPFLFHALQITANQGQPQWNDTVANTVLYLLSIATFLALYLLLRMLRGTAHATATVAAIISIPLLGVHLAQGYGDVNLLQYLLLSGVCLGLWIESNHKRKNRWLVLSGIFVAASVWTKSEGVMFGLLPWLFTLAVLCRRSAKMWRAALPAIGTALILSASWLIFALTKGLSLTPHSSDTMLQWHPEAVGEVIIALFGRGSFGVTWYALGILVPVFVIAAWRKHDAINRQQVPLLLWGSFVFALILFIYLCTPNVRYLLNAESFYRQMMVPASMLILACSLCLRRRFGRAPH